MKKTIVIKDRYKLKDAWLDLYRIDKSMAIMSENIKFLESLEKLALRKIESGRGRMSDVLMVQLKLNEVKEKISILESEKDIPITRINILSNYNIPGDVVIQENLDFPDNLSIEDYQIDQKHPQLSIFNQKKDIAIRQIAHILNWSKIARRKPGRHPKPFNVFVYHLINITQIVHHIVHNRITIFRS